jgi:hypothetical protein
MPDVFWKQVPSSLQLKKATVKQCCIHLRNFAEIASMMGVLTTFLLNEAAPNLDSPWRKELWVLQDLAKTAESLAAPALVDAVLLGRDAQIAGLLGKVQWDDAKVAYLRSAALNKGTGHLLA